MLFKPKYCCSCGEKIERLDWGFMASRRFCEICETEHLVDEWLSVAAPLLALCVGILGTAMLQRSARAEIPKDPVVQRAPVPYARDPSHSVNADKAAKPGTPSSGEDKFFCGAPTKKGTPCTRRVAAKGDRCWQHR